MKQLKLFLPDGKSILISREWLLILLHLVGKSSQTRLTESMREEHVETYSSSLQAEINNLGRNFPPFANCDLWKELLKAAEDPLYPF